MKKWLFGAVISLTFIGTFLNTGAAAEDLTSLAKPTIRAGAANSQIYFVMTDRFANGKIKLARNWRCLRNHYLINFMTFNIHA